jgi:hypothetical protein
LSYLSIWGGPASNVPANIGFSTINDMTGDTVTNAVLVGAGSDGSINALAPIGTYLTIDINGYFVPPSQTASGLLFFAITPCRVVSYAALTANVSSNFTIINACGIPANAQAFSLSLAGIAARYKPKEKVTSKFCYTDPASGKKNCQ